MNKYLLELKGLTTHFYSGNKVIPAIEDVSFKIRHGETLGIVGESGSGKSVTALSIMRLIPNPPGKIVSGEILLEGKNLLELSDNEIRNIRGNEISMIFQEPMTSLNPVYTIGNQLSEALILHQKLNKRLARQKSLEILEQVNISLPEKRLKQYPHELSGGMRQRVMIAMAISCMPKLLIADEPTTALDVTIQAQILHLIKGLKEELNTSVILITHDLGVVSQVADNVVIMYSGSVVEYADLKTLFKNPKHPYTIGLLKSIPKIGDPKKKLYSIKGSVPNPGEITKGCKFSNRCEYTMDICKIKEPPIFNIGENLVRCWKYKE